MPFGRRLARLAFGAFGFTTAWFGAAVLLLLAATVIHGIGETRTAVAADDGPTPLIHWKAVPPAIGLLTAVVAMGGFLAFSSLHAESRCHGSRRRPRAALCGGEPGEGAVGT